jgi:hypothetical protein
MCQQENQLQVTIYIWCKLTNYLLFKNIIVFSHKTVSK